MVLTPPCFLLSLIMAGPYVDYMRWICLVPLFLGYCDVYRGYLAAISPIIRVHDLSLLGLCPFVYILVW